jgi:hypothetical protein
MKAIYYLKASTVALLVFFAMNVNAAQIQVSGTDADLAAALALANTGDELVINGFIEMSATVTINKNVTFVGTDPIETGFEAPAGVSIKFFEFSPEVIEGAKLQFLNLGFYGANNITVGDDGGVGRILNGTTEFRNCIFDGNKTAGRGGALYLANPATGGPAVANFIGCTISANTAGTTGGAIFIAGDFISSYDHCIIKENSSPNDRGGAFFIEGNGQHRFYYSVIKSNTSGIAGALDAGEKGGAAFVTSGNAALTFESSAIVSNVAYGNHGAAFFVMGDPNITLINSTVANNSTKAGAGGWFLATGSTGVDITLVNSFNIFNSGTNSGNAGGGFRVMNLNNRFNFFNSVIAGNTTENEGAVDLGFSSTPGIADGLVIKNSIIGLISGVDAGVIPAAVDKAGINPSLVNEYNLGGQTAQIDWATLDQSGIDWTDGLQSTSGFGMPFYTLTSADVYAAKMGDPALLANYDLNTDLFGVQRTVTAGAIFAGPVQSVVEFAPDVLDPQTGIQTPSIQKNSTAIRIIGTVSNGILGVDFGNLSGRAKGELISVTGQVVENVFNLNVVGKGYYNVKTTAQGVYILRVTMNGKAYTTPLILN